MMQQNLLVGSLEALQQSEKNQRQRNQLGEHQKSRTARLLPSAAKRLSEMKTDWLLGWQMEVIGRLDDRSFSKVVGSKKLKG